MDRDKLKSRFNLVASRIKKGLELAQLDIESVGPPSPSGGCFPLDSMAKDLAYLSQLFYQALDCASNNVQAPTIAKKCEWEGLGQLFPDVSSVAGSVSKDANKEYSSFIPHLPSGTVPTDVGAIKSETGDDTPQSYLTWKLRYNKKLREVYKHMFNWGPGASMTALTVSPNGREYCANLVEVLVEIMDSRLDFELQQLFRQYGHLGGKWVPGTCYYKACVLQNGYCEWPVGFHARRACADCVRDGRPCVVNRKGLEVVRGPPFGVMLPVHGEGEGEADGESPDYRKKEFWIR